MSSVVAADPQALIADSIRKIGALATLPEVTVQIIRTVEDPRSTASQLHKIVSHDPALVTRMLKVVNSAFYGLPGQIASVERAIVLLGLNAVKNIAVAASLGKLFRNVRLCEGYTARDLWQHCVAVAVTSRELARLMRLPIADEAFLAGMIHDVGILVELQTKPDQIRQACETARLDPNCDFCQMETATLGIDHQMLGAALAEHWKFPRSCQLVAGYHHRPTALADENRTLVTLVYAADTLCCSSGNGFTLTGRSQKLDEVALLGISLDPAMIRRVEQDLPKLLEASAAFL
jgi:putative nucleotidyltransferase with HDIG domain